MEDTNNINKPQNGLYFVLSIIWLIVNSVLLYAISYATEMFYPAGFMDFRGVGLSFQIIIEAVIVLPVLISFYKSLTTVNNSNNNEVTGTKGKNIFLCILLIINNLLVSFIVISRINYLNKYSLILLVPIYFVFTVLLLRFHLASIFNNKLFSKIKNNLISNILFILLAMLTTGLSAFVYININTILDIKRSVGHAEMLKEQEASTYYFTYYKESKEDVGEIKETIYLQSWVDSSDKFEISSRVHNMGKLYVIKETHFNPTLTQPEIINYIKEKEVLMAQECYTPIPDVYKAELKLDSSNNKYLVEYILTGVHNIDEIPYIDKNINSSNILFLKSLGFTETKERGTRVEKNFIQILGPFSKDCRYPTKLNY